MKVFSPKYFFIIFAILLISCNNADKKEINTLLDKRQDAFEAKDENLYSDLILDSYNINLDGKKIDKEEVVNQFKLNISPFDKITFLKSERQISIKDGKANVFIDTTVDLAIEKEKSEYNTKELLILTKNNNENWKISKESKIDLFRGFVFGGGE